MPTDRGLCAWEAESAASEFVYGVHHVQLSYPQRAQQAVERFYGEVLGLARLLVPGRPGLSFLAGGQRIDLLPYREPAGAAARASAGLVQLALVVRDVDGLHQRLQAHGALALDVALVSEGRRCYARDPGGNLVELLELPATLAAVPPAAQPQVHPS
jgi:catechol 2,3-dioxygenase-like lactoylglutathione lyase family enzyme